MALLLAAIFQPMGAAAANNELILTAGGGSQPHSHQNNRTAGADYSFYRFERSPRQHLQIGVSYTCLRTNTDDDDHLWAVSIYPQLTLYPDRGSGIRALFPEFASPYFFVRALGPTYLSQKQLGEREQAKHFAFQAQVGFGLVLDIGREQRGLISLSYKHFSNGSLFKPNDGMDMPLVLSVGLSF